MNFCSMNIIFCVKKLHIKMKGDARSAPPDALSRFLNTMKIGLTQSTIPFEKNVEKSNSFNTHYLV